MTLNKLNASAFPWLGKLMPWLILSVSLLFTFWSAQQAKKDAEQKAQLVFKAEAEELIQAIQLRMEAYQNVLVSVAGLFAASERVEHREWNAYLNNIKINTNYFGMIGIGFVKHVPVENLPAHLREMRAEGHSSYAIHPAGKRANYSAIVFPLPPHGDRGSRLGFDMLTRPEMRVAMEFARDSGLPTITSKLNFESDFTDQKDTGFLMFLPVYENGAPSYSVEQRNKALVGYIYSRVHMQDLLVDTFRFYKPSLAIQILDGNSKNNQILYSDLSSEEQQKQASRAAFKMEKVLPVTSMYWTMRLYSKPYSDAVGDGDRYQMILGSGIIISFLLFAWSWALSTSRSRAVKLAESMTIESRNMALRMEHLAQHDPLTDLPNRLLLEDRLAQAIVQAARYKRKIALLFIDLDRFKHVNDSLGHLVGDKLLRELSGRLASRLRAIDTISRQGGDEFVILLPEIKNAGDARVIARQLQLAASETYVIDGHELHVSLSIGISIYPDDGTDGATLMKNADSAMYHAKNQGRNNYQFFTHWLGASAGLRLVNENSLRNALKNDELRIHFQPQIDYSSGKLIGAEALVRWQKTPDQLIGPAEFIPLAEETGFIVEIDKWVVGQVCLQNRAWQLAGLNIVPVSVNLSMMNFNQSGTLESIMNSLNVAGLEPRFLEVELTETVLAKNPGRVKAALKAMKEIGISIAIDDFGTGHSSLSYLTQFHIDTLKIDQAFVRDLVTTTGSLAITRAIIGMAKGLRYRVIAEGVESVEQAEILSKNGCKTMQGYLFSRPVPAVNFEVLLQNPDKLIKSLRDEVILS